MRTKLNRLTLSERVVIETLLSQKKNLIYIANQLDRKVSCQACVKEHGSCSCQFESSTCGGKCQVNPH
jgi:IS30 family transposase